MANRNGAKGSSDDTLSDRFWSKVDASGAHCWEWVGARSPQNYGQLWHPVRKKVLNATHFSIYLTTGEWPATGMHVCHKCDNPPCVRPDHLFVGTRSDNMQDSAAKGRSWHPEGETATNAKLSTADVEEIRRRFVKGTPSRLGTGRSSAELSAEFGVSAIYVAELARNKWRRNG